jgi:hypothetical protein
MLSSRVRPRLQRTAPISEIGSRWSPPSALPKGFEKRPFSARLAPASRTVSSRSLPLERSGRHRSPRASQDSNVPRTSSIPESTCSGESACPVKIEELVARCASRKIGWFSAHSAQNGNRVVPTPRSRASGRRCDLDFFLNRFSASSRPPPMHTKIITVGREHHDGCKTSVRGKNTSGPGFDGSRLVGFVGWRPATCHLLAGSQVGDEHADL